MVVVKDRVRELDALMACEERKRVWQTYFVLAVSENRLSSGREFELGLQ